MPNLPANLIQEVTLLSDSLKTKFSPPEFIPGCQVMSVADIDEYATNNGWVEAICGPHNQQRVRWKSGETVGTANYIDVVHFPQYRIFEAWGLGGSGAIPSAGGGGGWPGAGKAMINTTEYDSVTDAITASSAGDIIKIGQGTFTETLTVNKAVTLVGLDAARTVITTATGSSTTAAVSAAAVFRNLTLQNTGSASIVADITADGVVMDGVTIANSGGGALATGVLIQAGNTTGHLLRNCKINVSAGTTKYAIWIDTAASKTVIEGGEITGDILVNNSGATLELRNVALLSGIIDAQSGILRGTALDDKGRDCGKIVKNTSGAAVARGDMGYLDSAGEFKTTTTEGNFTSSEVSVTVGGPNNGWIFVKRSGNQSLNYTGTAPSVGDVLILSTTAGKVKTNGTTMHPGIVAKALAAGSGGAVEALLLCNTAPVPVFSANRLLTVSAHTDTGFTATINGAPSGASVTYTPVSGNEDSINPGASTYIGKIRLYNSTRGTYALISTVNTSTNVITLTANAPAGWASGDTITANSQVNTDTSVGSYFDVELTGTDVPELARGFWTLFSLVDSGGTGTNSQTRVHPWEAFSDAKRQTAQSIVTSGVTTVTFYIPLIARRFTFSSGAVGSGTKTDNFAIITIAEVASP